MTQGKLKDCLATLSLIEKRNHLSFNELLTVSKITKNKLENILDLLVKNNLVTEHNNKDKNFYTVTQQADITLKFFNVPEQQVSNRNVSKNKF